MTARMYYVTMGSADMQSPARDVATCAIDMTVTATIVGQPMNAARCSDEVADKRRNCHACGTHYTGSGPRCATCGDEAPLCPKCGDRHEAKP